MNLSLLLFIVVFRQHYIVKKVDMGVSLLVDYQQ